MGCLVVHQGVRDTKLEDNGEINFGYVDISQSMYACVYWLGTLGRTLRAARKQEKLAS